MEQVSTPTHSWERPWTTEEMREHSANWTLAGDSGLLKHLQQFSQSLLTRTHSTNQKMDGLFEDLRNTTTEVNNVTNSFLSLSNTQFVESRVYDDEDKETPKEETKVQELTKEQKQAQVVNQVSEALTLGMSVLDTMFNVVQVSGSDSEEEESIPSSVHTILEPKNPYLNRPLPYLIGSKEFMEDDKVGLGDPTSVTEDNISRGRAPSSNSQEDTVPPQIPSSSSECSDLESDHGSLKRRSASIPAAGIDDSESLFEVPQGEDMFGRKSPHDFSPPEPAQKEKSQPKGQASFAEELAAKLGGVAAQEPQSRSQLSRPPDDLFSPRADDEDDTDSLFGGGRFSAPSGLFDDLDQPSKSPMPKTKTKVEKTVPVQKTPVNTGSLFSDDLFNATETDEDDDMFSVSTTKKSALKATDQGKEDKKPPGGVSIFGKDLFGSSDSAQDASKRLFSIPKRGPSSICTSTPDSRDEDSDNDFFGEGQNISIIKKNSKTLFANMDDDTFSSPLEDPSSASKVHPGAVSKNFAESPSKSSANLSWAQSDLPSNASFEGTLDKTIVEPSAESGLGSSIERTARSTTKLSQDLESSVLPVDVGDVSEFNPKFTSSRVESGTSSFPSEDGSGHNIFNRFFEGAPSRMPSTIVPGDSSPSIAGPSKANHNSKVHPGAVSKSFAESPSKSSANLSWEQSDLPSNASFENTLDKTIVEPESGLGSSTGTTPLLSQDVQRAPSKMPSTIKTVGPSSSSTTAPSKAKNSSKLSGLFDSDSDEADLFSRTNLPSIRSVDKGEAEKRPLQKKSLFSNDEELFKTQSNEPIFDIFGSAQSEKQTASKSNIPSEKSTATKPAGKPDFLEDDDEIDIFSPKINRPLQRSTGNQSSIFDSGEDTVDDIFAVHDARIKPTSNVSANLFDNAEDLYPAANSSKSISERLFEDLESGSMFQPEPSSVLPGVDVKTTPKPEPPSSLNIRKPIDLFSSEDLFGGSIDTTKPDSDISSSSSTLLNNDNPISNQSSLFSNIEECGIEDIFSDVTSINVNKSLSTTKSNSGKQLVDSSESSHISKGQKPQVSSKPNLKDAESKSRPEIKARSSKTSTDVISQGKPSVAPRTNEKTNSNKREPTSQDVTQPTVISGSVSTVVEKALTAPLKGSKAQSIEERGKIINPTALLPGSRPAKGAAAERPVTFEEAVPTTTTLHSAAKERAKIPVKRRPQSRRARQEAIRSSAIFDDESPTLGSPGYSDETKLSESSVKISLPNEPNVIDRKAGGDAFSRHGASPGEKPSSLFSPETDEGEDLFGMPQDLPDYDPKEDLGGNLFGGAPVLSPLSPFQPSGTQDSNKLEDIPRADSDISNVSKSPELFKTTIDEKREDSLFDNASEELFSNGSKKPENSMTQHTTTGKSQVMDDRDPFSAGIQVDAKKDQKEASDTDDIFASHAGSKHSDMFTKGKRLTKPKEGYTKDDLFPVDSDDQGFGGDVEDSLFKSTNSKDHSSMQKTEPVDVKTEENKIIPQVEQKSVQDDLFEEESKSMSSRTTKMPSSLSQLQNPLNVESSDTISSLTAQPIDFPNANNSGEDLFGSGTAKSRLIAAVEEDLFSVKTSDRTSDNKKNKSPMFNEDEDLFSVGPTHPTSQKVGSTKQNAPSLFDDAGEDDMFAAGPAKKKSTTAPATTVKQGIRKPVTKSLFDDDEDDGIFNASALSSTHTKPAGSGQPKVKKTKPDSSTLPTKNSDFQDPLMALKKE